MLIQVQPYIHSSRIDATPEKSDKIKPQYHMASTGLI